MPRWFMAMPSQMPMTPNSRGTPPAPRTPALTASTTLRRCTWPGTTSLKALATPMNGFSISASLMPSARSSERCGARATPRLISSLLTLTTPFPRGPAAAGGAAGGAGREPRMIPETVGKA